MAEGAMVVPGPTMDDSIVSRASIVGAPEFSVRYLVEGVRGTAFLTVEQMHTFGSLRVPRWEDAEVRE